MVLKRHFALYNHNSVPIEDGPGTAHSNPWSMEIRRDTFEEGLQKLQQSLKKADFIAGKTCATLLQR